MHKLRNPIPYMNGVVVAFTQSSKYPNGQWRVTLFDPKQREVAVITAETKNGEEGKITFDNYRENGIINWLVDKARIISERDIVSRHHSPYPTFNVDQKIAEFFGLEVDSKDV